MIDDQTLKGRRALVTGGSRGIGASIALALALAGADIAVNYRSREAEALEVQKAVEEIGRKCILVKADVAKSAEISRMLAEIKDQLGGVEILVNNAGIAVPQQIENIDEHSWDETMDTNLKSAFLITQALLPAMRKAQWGRIINMSSVAAQLGGVVGPHYAASKAGLIGLTHSYAALLAKEGITVNAVAPALIATEMVTANLRARPELIPVGRFGHPEEVSDVVVMLACNGYITGQTISVNGGWYMT
ncbi:MAG TPA: 3-oxoacyl-ACP reductase family protein [Geobacteraceae bacterium]|nr:3-oxoacyl-ACP reductase family protein [Geobacteraceae bacterium]